MRPLQVSREAPAEADERQCLLGELFGAGGESVRMQPPFFCARSTNIELCARVFFNFNCIVLDDCRVEIGNFTLFGLAVQIYTATHPFNAGARSPASPCTSARMGGWRRDHPTRRADLLARGDRAGSVVTRDVPEGVFAAGNPCRTIREITE